MDLYCEALGVDQQDNLTENCVMDNNHADAQIQEDVNTILNKNNSRYHREMSKNTKHAYSDDKYTRHTNISERAKHRHQDRRKKHCDNRYSNYGFEERKRHDDFKHKRHNKQDRDGYRHSKTESSPYRLDREIKKEPDDYSLGHSSKSYEDRSREQSTSKYQNDNRNKDSQRFHNKEHYSKSRDYDSDRSERSSKCTNRYKDSDRHRRSDDYNNQVRKRKHNNDRPIEDAYIQYYDIKREKSEENAYEDNRKRKK